MGTADKAVRIFFSVVITILYFTGYIPGTLGLVFY